MGAKELLPARRLTGTRNKDHLTSNAAAPMVPAASAATSTYAGEFAPTRTTTVNPAAVRAQSAAVQLAILCRGGILLFAMVRSIVHDGRVADIRWRFQQPP